MQQQAAEAGRRVASGGRVRSLAYTALFVALTAVCAWIVIPTAVPFTMQTLAVFLSAGLLGGRRAALAVLAYLALGAAGLPVFSGFTGGVSRLLGPTGGYLIGFVFTALVTGAIIRRFGRRRLTLYLAMGAGLLACYAFGTAWFCALYTRGGSPMSLSGALSLCVLPFLLPDALKIALAAYLIRRLGPLRLP